MPIPLTEESPKNDAEEATQADKPEDVVSGWNTRVKKAEENLEPYWKAERRYWEHWWMWAEREGPLKNNYVPPDGHGLIESVTPRVTKSPPHLNVLPRITAETTPEQAEALMTRTAAVRDLLSYADQEMGFEAFFERFVKRGTWMDLAVEKITWRTETAMQEVEEPVYRKFLWFQVRAGMQKVQKPVVIYDSPVSELLDNTDFIYPLGYATVETLPWFAHRIAKWRSELSDDLYNPKALKELDASKDHKLTDHKGDRLRVREFPEPLKPKDTEERNATVQATSSEGLGNKKDDYKVELLEIWVKRCKDHPQGRLITIGNGKTLLRDIPNPTPDGELPLNVWSPIEDTYHLRGMGLMRELEKALLYKKKQRNQRLDNVDILVNGMGLLKDTETVEDDEFISFANNVVRLADINSYKPLSRPDTTGSSMREEEYIGRDMQTASAFNPYVAGAQGDKDATATEVAKITQGSGDRYEGMARTLNRALARRGRLILKLYQRNWDQARLARLVGPNGAVSFKQLDPLEFEGDFEFQYDVRPSLVTKEVVRNQLRELIGTLAKLPANDPRLAGLNLRPLIRALIRTFEEIRVNPEEVLPELPPPPPVPLPLPPGPDGQPPGPPAPEGGAPQDLSGMLGRAMTT